MVPAVISDGRGFSFCAQASGGLCSVKQWGQKHATVENSPPNQVIDMIRSQRSSRHVSTEFIRTANMQTALGSGMRSGDAARSIGGWGGIMMMVYEGAIVRRWGLYAQRGKPEGAPVASLGAACLCVSDLSTE